MYSGLLKNSYIVMILAFVVLCIIFYLFEIGYSTTIEYVGNEDCLEKGTCAQTKVVKKFSWKYPLAIALVVWMVWHFYLYPPKDLTQPTYEQPIETPNSDVMIGGQSRRSSEANIQKINMNNWN